MNCFRDYDKFYPDLVVEILDYFRGDCSYYGSINERTVMGFCQKANDGRVENNQRLYYQSD